MAAFVAPIVLNPGFWAAVGEAALWTAGAIGLVGTAYVASEAINEMSSDNAESTSTTTTTTTTCADCETQKPCPACSPPAGTVEVERVDRVPPSRAHYPCPGDHYHTRVMRQNPRTCACFWNKGPVHCLPQGGNPP